MFEKLITNLKNILPAPLKKMLGGKDSTDEETEGSQDDDQTEVETESSSLNVEEAQKKKKTMIIRVIVIVALAYVAFDEFVLKESTPEPTAEEIIAQAQAKRKKRKKPIPPPTEVTAVKSDTTSTPPEAINTEKTETPVENNEKTEAKNEGSQEGSPPLENINITEKTEEVISTKEVPTDSLDEKLDQLNEKVSPPIEVKNEVTKEIVKEATIEEVKIPSQKKELPETQMDVGEAEPNDKANNMTSKIVEDLPETPPPSYDHLGRGLVYNCKDKYWACVDKPSFVTCNKNMKFNQANGKAIECSIQAIYASDEDCAKIQKYNVSTNVDTKFCGP